MAHLLSTRLWRGAAGDQVHQKQYREERAFRAPVKSPSPKTRKELGEHLGFLVQRTWWASLTSPLLNE